MLQTGEFNHGHIVAAGLQLQTTQAVGQIFGEAVLQNAVFQHRLVHLASDLAEKLVLTAWYA